MASRMALRKLRLENYQTYYNHPSDTFLYVLQLNEILRLHGYNMLRHKNNRKECLLEALSGIDNLLNPHRSTLNETLPSCNSSLTVDEVITDLTALSWQEDFTVASLECLSFTDCSNTGVTDIIPFSGAVQKQRKKRVRKVKEKAVFDAVCVVKPRSKNHCVKRKHLCDITNTDRTLAILR